MDMPFTAPSELEEDGDPDLIPSKNGSYNLLVFS